MTRLPLPTLKPMPRIQRRRRRQLAMPMQRHLGGVWLVVLLWGMLASVVAAFDEYWTNWTKLPRLEVQFLCDRNLQEEGFNALKVFQEFYHDQIFSKDDQDLPTIDFNDASSSSSSTTNSTNSSSQPLPPTPPTTKQRPYELELFVAVAINTAADVNNREWYYDRCDAESNETLVTVDLRGYWQFLGEGTPPWDPPCNPSTWFDSDFGHIESYLSSKVCQGQPMDFFRVDFTDWQDHKYPIPEGFVHKKSEYVAKGGGHVVFPGTSILERGGYKEQTYHGSKDHYYRRYQQLATTGGYEYDHDLYIVCQGIHLDADPVELPSNAFLVMGILCGYLMIVMIKTEVTRPLRHRQLPPRNRVQGPIDERRNNNHSNSNTNNSNASNDTSNDTSNNTNTATNDTFEDEHTDDREDTRRQRQEIEMTAWML